MRSHLAIAGTLFLTFATVVLMVGGIYAIEEWMVPAKMPTEASVQQAVIVKQSKEPIAPITPRVIRAIPMPEAPPPPPVEDRGLIPHVVQSVTFPKPKSAPPPVSIPVDPPVLRPVPAHAAHASVEHHNNDGVCAKYGGHKVTFHKRNGWESWRCEYPEKHR